MAASHLERFSSRLKTADEAREPFRSALRRELRVEESARLLISEEKTWSWLRIGRTSKYGNIVTHCPLSRLEGFNFSQHGPLATLDLAVRAGATGEAVQVALPSRQKTAVSEIVLQAFQQKEATLVTAR